DVRERPELEEGDRVRFALGSIEGVGNGVHADAVGRRYARERFGRGAEGFRRAGIDRDRAAFVEEQVAVRAIERERLPTPAARQFRYESSAFLVDLHDVRRAPEEI